MRYLPSQAHVILGPGRVRCGALLASKAFITYRVPWRRQCWAHRGAWWRGGCAPSSCHHPDRQDNDIHREGEVAIRVMLMQATPLWCVLSVCFLTSWLSRAEGPRYHLSTHSPLHLLLLFTYYGLAIRYITSPAVCLCGGWDLPRCGGGWGACR